MNPSPAPAVLNALVEHRRRFLAFLELRLGDRAAAEDVLQDAWLKALAAASDLREEGRAVPWFYQVLRNALTDHWRRRGTERAALDRLALELVETHEPAPELAAELCGCVEALLPALDPAAAEVLRRIDLAGERAVDYARSEAITANAATVRLHRARRALRQRLLQSCGVCASHGCLDCGCRSGERSPAALGKVRAPDPSPSPRGDTP